MEVSLSLPASLTRLHARRSLSLGDIVKMAISLLISSREDCVGGTLGLPTGHGDTEAPALLFLMSLETRHEEVLFVAPASFMVVVTLFPAVEAQSATYRDFLPLGLLLGVEVDVGAEADGEVGIEGDGLARGEGTDVCKFVEGLFGKEGGGFGSFGQWWCSAGVLGASNDGCGLLNRASKGINDSLGLPAWHGNAEAPWFWAGSSKCNAQQDERCKCLHVDGA